PLKSFLNDAMSLTTAVKSLRDKFIEFTSANDSMPTDRDELLAGASATDLDSASLDQRARLLNGTERLADSSRRLQESHRIALETGKLFSYRSSCFIEACDRLN
ncbi:2413_t:CDS:2, partial [Racocetra fulgida]